jgi:hypothetical protein
MNFAVCPCTANSGLPALAAVLGHTTTRMVELHYGHFAPGWVRDHVRATALGIGAGDETTTLVPLEQHRL